MIFTAISFDERLENPVIMSRTALPSFKNNYYILENPLTGDNTIFYSYIFHQPNLPEPSPKVLLPTNLKYLLFPDTESGFMLKMKPVDPLKSI